ncbi:MAG TPA: hypothetical protein EYQ50_11405 [Verrucomicrobiales bacterium]|nr:hypothetical protein [Verrucomicrobiales bacterium]
MQNKQSKIGFLNLVVILVIGVASGLVSKYAGAVSGYGGIAFLLLGSLIALISYVHMRLLHREDLEQMEFDEMMRTKKEAALFSTDAETFPARQSRVQFERFIIPSFTILLLILEAAFAWFFLKAVQDSVPPLVSRATVSMAFFSFFGLVLLLFGKYAAGVSRLEKQRILKPVSGFMMLGAFTLFALAIVEAAVKFDYPFYDRYLGYVFVGMLVLFAMENFINLVLEIYRPRIKDKVERLLYESRLVGFISHPSGIVTSVAHALDYQFGFKVSETWFYRFLEQAFAWLVILQLSTLFLSTTVTIIEPHEKALLERFGKPVAGKEVLEPGLHLKLPWPIDKVYRYPATEIQTFNIGYEDEYALEEEDDGHGHGHGADSKDDENETGSHVIAWAQSHGDEHQYFLVAGNQEKSVGVIGSDEEVSVPVSFLEVEIPVQYQIEDLQAWAYNNSNSAGLLKKIAFREVVDYLLGVDMEWVMGEGREKAATDLKERFQAAVKRNKLGARIVLVGLQDSHPPKKVAEAFESVDGAEQEQHTKVLEAEGYAKSHCRSRQNSRRSSHLQGPTYFPGRCRSQPVQESVVSLSAGPECFFQMVLL